MITIATKRLNTFLPETRRVLGIRKRIRFQPITFEASNDTLTLRSRTDDVAIGCQINGKFGEAAFAVSLHDLSLVRHARGDIHFSPAGNCVNVSWQEPPITISRTLPTCGSPIYYECPKVLYSNDTSLAQALLCATQTTDSKSLRYSIGCVRLRSSDGQIAATDGRHAYVHSGFSLPAGELLVPAAALKSFALLSEAESISVGLRDDWVCFRTRVGDCRWSIDIKRQLTGRFPDLDRRIPHPRSARSTLVISHDDADFLIDRLRRLPSDPAAQGPITLDLAKRPVVRFKARNNLAAKGRASATETPDADQEPC